MAYLAVADRKARQVSEAQEHCVRYKAGEEDGEVGGVVVEERFDVKRREDDEGEGDSGGERPFRQGHRTGHRGGGSGSRVGAVVEGFCLVATPPAPPSAPLTSSALFLLLKKTS